MRSAKLQIGKNADRQAPKSQQNSKSVKMLTGERRKSQQNSVTSKNADLKIYMKREMRDNK